MVFNKDNQWIVKPFPKNYDSTRIITIDKDLAKLIRSTGCIYDGHPGQITEEMKLAAAEALAALVSDEELNEDFIMPEAFDPRVAEVVSEAVKSHVR